MGCSLAKTKQQVSFKCIEYKSSQNEILTQSNFYQENKKYNLMKNPIIKRRTEKRNKLPNTKDSTPIQISR